jgi:hypothetical protein
LAQFAETAKLSKENKIAELYDEIDVEFYEEARTMVCLVHTLGLLSMH